MTDLELPPEFQEFPLEQQPNPDGSYNAADPKAVNDAKKKAARERMEDLRIIQLIMESQDGRKWVHRFLERCQVLGNPFVPGMPDATGFNLGKQDVGKALWADIMEVAEKDCLLMMREAREEK